MKRNDFLRAILHGDCETTEHFLSTGEDPNQKDAFGVPAVIYALHCRKSEKINELLKLLIRYGAKIKSKSNPVYWENRLAS